MVGFANFRSPGLGRDPPSYFPTDPYQRPNRSRPRQIVDDANARWSKPENDRIADLARLSERA
jgi:hypothetical protein